MTSDSSTFSTELGITLPVMKNNITLIKNDHPLMHRSSQLLTDDELANPDHKSRLIAPILLEAMNSYLGLGISACQLGIDVSMFAMNVDGISRICCNPQIVAASSEMEKQREGCLSFPGLELNVNRPVAIVVRYYNVDCVEVTEHLDGLAARVWLHEYDHCNGICFTKRVSKLSLNMATKKLSKINKRKN